MHQDLIYIDYQIQFDTPFHFGTGLCRDLLDRSVCRDANGYLYIPGSTLKGVTRERCEQIAHLFNISVVSPHDEKALIANFKNSTDIIERIFGSRYKPGELYFDNATMIKTDKEFFESDLGQIPKRYIHLQTESRTQTSISRLLGTVKEQALFQSEFGIKSLCFEGQIYGHLEGFRIDENEWSYALLLLVAGICANDRIGANKSTGMGKYDCEIQNLSVNKTRIEITDVLETLNKLECYHSIQEDTV